MLKSTNIAAELEGAYAIAGLGGNQAAEYNAKTAANFRASL